MNRLLDVYPGDLVAVAVLTIVFQVSVVVVAAWLLAATARRHAAAKSTIWLCALVCLLAGPLISVALRGAGVSFVELKYSVADIEKPSPPPRPARVAWAEPKPSIQTHNAVPLSALETHPPPGAIPATQQRSFTTLSRADRFRAAGGAAVIIWLCGMLACCVRFFIGCCSLKRLRSKVVAIDPSSVGDVLEDARRTLGVSRLPLIVESRLVTSPVAAGGFGPAMVLLPENLLKTLPSRGLRDVLVHECAHIIQRDFFVGLLQRLVEILFWPHPLVHFLNRRLTQAREEICDNYVLRASKASEFARTLLRVSEVMPTNSQPLIAAGLLRPRFQLESRVVGLLDERRSQMTRLAFWKTAIVAVALLGTITLIAGTQLLEAAPDAPVASGEPTISENSDRDAKPSKRSQPSASAKKDVKNELTGHIYATVFLRTRPEGADGVHYELALISIDPVTGEYKTLYAAGPTLHSVRIAPDGQTAVFRKGNEIWNCDTHTADNPGKIADAGSPRCWSPDGTHFVATVFSKNDKGGRITETWLIRLDGTTRSRMDIPPTDSVHDWSPDGKWLVTVSWRDKKENYQLYRMQRDGTRQQRITKNGRNLFPRFSPDSKRILFQHDLPGPQTVRVMDLDGNNQRVIYESEGLTDPNESSWSPDGKHVAILLFDWQLDENGRKFSRPGNDANYRLLIMDADGGKRRILRLKLPKDVTLAGFNDFDWQ